MLEKRNFGVEIENERKILENLAKSGSRGQNAEAVLRSMRKLWAILMDTEFIGLDEKIRASLTSGSKDRIGMNIAHDLRRVSVLERYFRTRARGFLPYIAIHHGVFVFLRRGENLDRILTLYQAIEEVATLTLEKIENQ